MCGLGIDKVPGRGGFQGFLAVAIVMNLGILGVFRYSAFLVNNLNAILPVDLLCRRLRCPSASAFTPSRPCRM